MRQHLMPKTERTKCANSSAVPFSGGSLRGSALRRAEWHYELCRLRGNVMVFTSGRIGYLLHGIRLHDFRGVIGQAILTLIGGRG